MSSKKPRKSVLFHDDVMVHNFEIEDGNNRRRNSTIEMPSNDCNGSRSCNDIDFSRRKPPSSYSVPLSPEDTIVRYSLVRDRMQRQILLQFSVPLGPTYGPKGVMVKANLHGTKIRVMACSKKPTTTPDGQTVKVEYNETFPLPVAVDPQRVTARVDNLGYLTIGAPILRGI